MNFSRYFILSLTIIILTGCDFNFSPDNDALARVGDEYLFIEDIKELSYSEGKDSTTIINNYINRWINDKLLLEKAIQNLPEDQIDFDKQLKEYHNSLIIYAYETQIINEKLDTNISSGQIHDYYLENIDNFLLREDLYQILMIQVLPSAPNKDSLKIWFLETDSLEFDKLEDYCRSYSQNCILDSTSWITEESLLNYMGLKDVSEFYYQKGKNIMEDSTRVIYFDFINKRAANEYAPLEYVKLKIKEIIKNQRRIVLLNDIRNQIVKSASLKGSYEVYYK